MPSNLVSYCGKKWIPAAKEQWVTFTTHVEPYLQKASTKTIEIYEVSKSTVSPHIAKAQELADPYVKVFLNSFTLIGWLRE